MRQIILAVALVSASDASTAEPLPPGAVARVGTTWLRENGSIASVALSADDRLVAWGGEGGMIRIADAATGKRLIEFALNPDKRTPVTELAFSPDGGRIAAGGFWSKDLRCFETATGKLVHTIANSAPRQDRWSRRWQGDGFAFTRDGKGLLIAGKDGAIRCWDFAKGEFRWTAAITPEPALNLALTADGATVMTAHYGGEMHLWRGADGKHLDKLEGSAKWPHLTALSPDGTAVARATGADGAEIVRLGKNTRFALPTERHPLGLAFTADGATLRIAEGDGAISSWDARSGKLVGRAVTHDGWPPRLEDERHGPKTSARFRTDGLAVALIRGGCIRLWDLAASKESPQLPGLRTGVTSVHFTADGRHLMLAGAEGEFGLWSAETGEPVGPLRRGPKDLRVRLVPSADRRLAVLTSMPREEARALERVVGSILRWTPDADAAPVALANQTAPAWYAALSPDHRLLAASETSNQVRIYDLVGGQPTRTFPVSSHSYPLVFSPDGKRLAVRTPARTIPIFEVASGQLIHDLPCPSPVGAIAYSPDGRTLVSGHATGMSLKGQPAPADFIILREAMSGRETRRFLTGHFTVNDLSFSPDGRLIASVGSSGSVKVWEVASGQLRREYAGHRAWTTGVDFAPDGKRLASSSHDGTAVVWRLFDEPTRGADLAAWNDLAGSGEAAHRAIAAMRAGAGAADFLARHVAPAAVPSDTQVAKWCDELGHADFAVRAAAEKELARVAELVRPALIEVRDNGSAEARRRAKALLDGIERPERRPDGVRELRAVEVLERIASPAARRHLATLAKGAPGAVLTRDAAAALKRLGE